VLTTVPSAITPVPLHRALLDHAWVQSLEVDMMFNYTQNTHKINRASTQVYYTLNVKNCVPKKQPSKHKRKVMCKNEENRPKFGLAWLRRRGQFLQPGGAEFACACTFFLFPVHLCLCSKWDPTKHHVQSNQSKRNKTIHPKNHCSRNLQQVRAGWCPRRGLLWTLG
jgi:hypothetical protein